jgi:hypothetical protein
MIKVNKIRPQIEVRTKEAMQVTIAVLAREL